jgi:hypothetical protein
VELDEVFSTSFHHLLVLTNKPASSILASGFLLPIGNTDKTISNFQLFRTKDRV